MYADLNPNERILLGPGPSTAHPRVLRAMATPLLGHLDPQFLQLMNQVQELLRFVFQTENQLTIPLPGTGTSGMDAAMANFLEPGQSVIVGVNGYFGERLDNIARRHGVKVRRLERPWGEVFTPEEIQAELEREPADMVALVQAETSTGAMQPMGQMGEIAHRYGALLVMDCVTSLGGLPIKLDEWGVDIAYSCSQKCLSCPPGLAPFSVSPRALQVLKERKSPVCSFYLDLTILAQYWGTERTYHHTAPISMNYALREGLRLVHEEGLEARFARHREMAELLWQGLTDLGLQMRVPAERRLPMLTTVVVPDGVDEAGVRKRLLDEYNIEIAGGLGALKGKIWRIGLMGYSCRKENVTLLLAALKELLNA